MPELVSKMRTRIDAKSKFDLGRDEDGYLLTINDRNGEILRRVVRFSLSEHHQIHKIANMLLETNENLIGDHKILLAALVESARRIIITNEENKQ